MGLIDFPVSETVLLTGAGFTHNFGGFLANAVWAEIHNYFLRNYTGPTNSRIVDEIKNNFNYEDLYQSIGDSDGYNSEEKKFLSRLFCMPMKRWTKLSGVINTKLFLQTT